MDPELTEEQEEQLWEWTQEKVDAVVEVRKWYFLRWTSRDLRLLAFGNYEMNNRETRLEAARREKAIRLEAALREKAIRETRLRRRETCLRCLKDMARITRGLVFLSVFIAAFLAAFFILFFSRRFINSHNLFPFCNCRASDTYLNKNNQIFPINNDHSKNLDLVGTGNNNNNNNNNNNTNPQIVRNKFLGLVGVQTSFHSVNRRAALRSTWFPSDRDAHLRLELTTELAFCFVIGRSKDAKKMADLEKERSRYGDFMLLDVEDEHINLAYKTLAFFKAAYDQFQADYYIKVDDSIYLRPDRLAVLLLKERTDPMTYIACMKRRAMINDPMKWSEKSGHVIGNEYFVYGYGPIFVLSEEIVATLVIAKITSLRMLSNEDVSVGLWMLAMNVTHEDNRALCDRQCTPTSIAVWDFPGCSGVCHPVNRLKELHKISMCSKSPTLPSD